MFISNILYTDITEHFNLIKNFESRAYESNFGEQEEDVKLLSGMIIHTSDFTGGAKQFDVAK
jgi:calcium/calmodulin-dependent 3',5'-cyclic nucleotide phosphodiesterase